MMFSLHFCRSSGKLWGFTCSWTSAGWPVLVYLSLLNQRFCCCLFNHVVACTYSVLAVHWLIMCFKSSSFESLPNFLFIHKKTQNHRTQQRWRNTIAAYVKPNYIERFRLYIGYRCAVFLFSAIVLPKTVFTVWSDVFNCNAGKEEIIMDEQHSSNLTLEKENLKFWINKSTSWIHIAHWLSFSGLKRNYSNYSNVSIQIRARPAQSYAV